VGRNKQRRRFLQVFDPICTAPTRAGAAGTESEGTDWGYACRSAQLARRLDAERDAVVGRRKTIVLFGAAGGKPWQLVDLVRPGDAAAAWRPTAAGAVQPPMSPRTTRTSDENSGRGWTPPTGRSSQLTRSAIHQKLIRRWPWVTGRRGNGWSRLTATSASRPLWMDREGLASAPQPSSIGADRAQTLGGGDQRRRRRRQGRGSCHLVGGARRF